MSHFEVQTPALKQTTDALLDTLSQLQSGTIDRNDAKAIVATCNAVTQGIGQELKVQQVQPRLIAMRAKMIDGVAVKDGRTAITSEQTAD